MKNSEYWKQRFTILEDAANKQAASVNHTLESQFRKAQQDLEAQIQTWYSRFATNNQINMAEARRLLNTKELAEFNWDVKEYIKYGEQHDLTPAWMRQLENASAKFHITRLEALKIQTQHTMEVMFGNQTDVIDKLMKRTYLDGYYHTAYEVQKGFNIGWDIAAVNDGKLEKIISKPWTTDGRTFSDRIWQNKTGLLNEVHTQLTQNIILGKSPDNAIKVIATKMGTSKNNAGRLVMTESAYFSSTAQKDAFNELDVERFEIVATLDSHTSAICQSMDGQIFDMKDYEPGVTAPPFHPWCRTTTVPYFDDNFGERAARGEDGKTYYVPSNMKYPDWKKTFVDGGDKDGLQKTSESSIVKLPINSESEIYKKLGEEHYQGLHGILNASTSPSKDVWAKLENNLTVTDAHSKRHACCYGTGGISMDVPADAKGCSSHSPYQVVFHEFGHNIDYISNVKYGNGLSMYPYSFTYKKNLFAQTIKQEVIDQVDSIAATMKADFKAHKGDFEWLYQNDYISQWSYDYYKQYGSWVGGEPSFSKSMAYAKLQKEVSSLSAIDRRPLSDILEGATNEKIQCGFGHGKAYWKLETHLPTEAFAQMYTSEISNPGSLASIKKYLPKSYELFLEMLENIMKG